jgi:hypothetical protein
MSPGAQAAEERGAALEAAARLLALAMRESYGPVGVLAGALERMAEALTQVTRALERGRAVEAERSAAPTDVPLGQLAAAQQALERDIALCIESLQFHDRLMQRLERVSGCLTSRASDSLATDRLCGAGSGEGSVELFE